MKKYLKAFGSVGHSTTKIYLAAPFSHLDPKVRAWRVEQADKKAAELMMQGYLVFSPLSHSYPISKHCDVDPCDHDFWLRQDLWLLVVCDELHVLCLDGWEDSTGINIEWKCAASLNKKIVHHEP